MMDQLITLRAKLLDAAGRVGAWPDDQTNKKNAAVGAASWVCGLTDLGKEAPLEEQKLLGSARSELYQSHLGTTVIITIRSFRYC